MGDENNVDVGIKIDSDAQKQLKIAVESFQKFEKAVTKSMGDGAQSTEKNAKKTTAALNKVQKEVKESTKAMTIFKSTFSALIAADLVKKLASSVISLGKAFIQTFVVDGVRAAQLQEDALNNLAQQMKLTNSFTREAFQDFQDFASAMQDVSTVGDETTLKMLSLAKTFGTTNQGAKDMVKAAIELAAATGGRVSVESAVVNLGKSLSGLSGELGEAVGEIRTLTAEELKAGGAIDLINARFKGSAAAAAKTYSGAIMQLENAFGDLQEKTGEVFTKSQSFITIINGSKRIIDELSDAMVKNSAIINGAFASGLLLGIKGVRLFIKATDGLVRAAKLLNNTLKISASATSIFGALATGDMNKVKAAIGSLAVATTDAHDGIAGIADPLGGAFDTALAKLEATLIAAEAVKGVLGPDQVQGEGGPSQTEIQASIDSQLALIAERNGLLAGMNDQAAKDEVALNLRKLKAIENLEDASTLQRSKAKKAAFDLESKMEADRFADQSATLNSISRLQSSKIKEVQAIGKAAAIASATRDTYAGATKALAAFPPPFGFIAAALVTTAGLLNVSKIAGVPGLKGGMTEVPGSGTQDNFPAILAPKERVVDANTNQDLKGFLSDSSQMVPILRAIEARLGMQDQRVVVNIGNKEVADVVREEIESGRKVV